jgi:hypothetical protein
MRLSVLGLVAVAVAAAGCTSSSSSTDRSVLMAGVSPGSSATVNRIGPMQAIRQGRASRDYFRRELKVGARRRPGEQFESPPLSELLPRVRHQAAKHHFRVVSLRMLHPKQLAPMLIVNTTHYVGLAHATASILHDLNGRYGDRYEGFYLEARDELGVPFFITETLRRDRTEGGQWARSEALYPFLHG